MPLGDRGSASLRSWLLALGLGGSFAALFVAGAAGWWAWHEYTERISASLYATSRAVSGSVDRELDQAVALARGLSTSGYLASGDLAHFEQQARGLIELYGYKLVLKAPDAEYQLVDTEVPEGAPAPKLSSTPIAPELWQGAVHVAPLRRSAISDVWFAAVEVPVLGGDGQLEYVISVRVPNRAFQRIIDDQHLPESWSPVILDSDWTVVARDTSRAKFLGRKGAAREFQYAPDGLHKVRLLDGDTAISAHSHSWQYGWTAAVAMPRGAMLAEATAPIVAASLSGFAVAMLAIGAVLVFTARIGQGIRSLALGTAALAKGERIVLPQLPVRELRLVGEGMYEAAEKIAASRQELESRIAAATSELRRETEERRKAEIALAHAQRLESLGQLTGGVTHDFNNLLTVIASSLELIERKSQDREIRRLAQSGQSGVARGARLVEALLAFARKQPLHTEVVNPNLAIKQFAPVLRGAAGDTVQFQLLASRTVYPCRIDKAQFQSAILNLVANARAAMPAGGRITIETENVEIGPGPNAHPPASALEAGSYVRVIVADTGFGMSPETAARAFEPFFTTKDVGIGTGLGLSQVYGFAKQSGGDVGLSSEPGIGTTVHLYLPRSQGADAPAQKPVVAEPRLEDAGGSARIMVVDDDREVRAALVQSIEALGHCVVEAADGRDALDRITAGEKVDLVLTDYLMPHGLTGRDLADRIAALGRGIRLVLMSGNLPPEAEGSALAILRKPVRLAELHRVISQALGR